jgi:hypothetical protein
VRTIWYVAVPRRFGSTVGLGWDAPTGAEVSWKPFLLRLFFTVLWCPNLSANIAAMPFETFKRQRSRPDDSPYVTIQKRGTLSFNRAAYAALGEPEAVELLFDREDRRIGIRRVDPSTAHAYGVRPLNRGATWLASGTAFVNYYGIETAVSRRWPAEAVDEGFLVIDLKEEGQEVTSNRAQAVGARDEPSSDGLGAMSFP